MTDKLSEEYFKACYVEIEAVVRMAAAHQAQDLKRMAHAASVLDQQTQKKAELLANGMDVVVADKTRLLAIQEYDSDYPGKCEPAYTYMRSISNH